MAKQIKFDAEARQKILAGVEKLSNAVTSTLGPSGRNVILDKKFQLVREEDLLGVVEK